MKKTKMLFIKNYKKVILTGVLVILFCVPFLDANDSKAVTDLGNYISIKLDTNDFFNDEIWEFQSVPGNHSFFAVTTNNYTPAGTTYECALFLVEEWGGINPDKPHIAWIEDEVILTTTGGNSLSSDAGGNYISCCNVAAAGPCASSSCMSWDENPASAIDVFERAYSAGWDDNCSGGDCALSSSDTYYAPDTEILCETTWMQCGATETSCNIYNGRTYACNNGFWDLCAGATPTCASGVCVAASGLSLSASASPTSIALNGNSTVTFEVTDTSGSDVSGATVSGISVTVGGGSVSAGSCGPTNASGECAVTYNAPAVSTVATIEATKATKAGETDSGSKNVNVTVNDCLPSSTIVLDKSSYTIGEDIKLSGRDNANNFSLCIYNSSNSLVENKQFGPVGFP